MSKVRTFIAIELPEEVRRKLVQVQDVFRGSGARVKWVAPQNLHLTVKFLGDVEFEEVSEISGVIKDAVSDIRPFRLSIKGTGSFGGRTPRVVWAGTQGDTTSLETVFKRLNDGLTRFGVPYEKRRFSPHVTIGRVRSSSGTSQLVETLTEYKDSDFGEAEVSELTLMQSELSSRGPAYTPLAHIAFGGI